MRRAPDERERRDPGGCGRSAESQAAWALAEEALAALREADLGRLIRMVGPHPRVAVDSGEEPGAADCPRLLRALGFTDFRIPWPRNPAQREVFDEVVGDLIPSLWAST